MPWKTMSLLKVRQRLVEAVLARYQPVNRLGRACAPGSTRVGARGSDGEAPSDAREGACAPHFPGFFESAQK